MSSWCENLKKVNRTMSKWNYWKIDHLEFLIIETILTELSKKIFLLKIDRSVINIQWNNKQHEITNSQFPSFSSFLQSASTSSVSSCLLSLLSSPSRYSFALEVFPELGFQKRTREIKIPQVSCQSSVSSLLVRWWEHSFPFQLHNPHSLQQSDKFLLSI